MSHPLLVCSGKMVDTSDDQASVLLMCCFMIINGQRLSFSKLDSMQLSSLLNT